MGEEGHGERNNSSLSSPSPLYKKCQVFTLGEIKLATNDFDEAFVIGKGGFGKVYKGKVGINTNVAIKRLNLDSDQGPPEFWAEIEMLSKFRHSHIVSLLGYCEKEMILVYEYMPNGSLEDHLHKKGSSSPLTWIQRLNICIGAARGLDYLHTGTGVHHRVIHRDVKSSNILLDEHLAGKIADFGLSRTTPASHSGSTTNVYTGRIISTFGYMDAEYFSTHRITRKYDVYAFGVVLLEVLCGRPALDFTLDEEQHSLAGWARHCIKRGNISRIIDPSLKGQVSKNCLKKFGQIAYECLHSHSKDRPTMTMILARLELVLTWTMQSLQRASNRKHIAWSFFFIKAPRSVISDRRKDGRDSGGIATASQQLVNSPKSQVRTLINLPMASSVPSLSVMERLVCAMDNIAHYMVDNNLLIQVWLPEIRDGKLVLSTSQRPFSLEVNCPQLFKYRNISESYHLPVERNPKDSIGLLGSAFMEKVPDRTPDVGFFKAEEYPRVSHAKIQDVRGSVAIPVFGQDVKGCIGVVEVVMTTQKSNYALEIEGVCKALEAFDLKSYEDSNTYKIKESNGFHHPALVEILEILTSACMMHNLPLAQTWIPCIQQGDKAGCRHSNENLLHCISTVNSASYVSDPRFKIFQEACSEHHLFIGQGVVGKAFKSKELFCYSPDVTSYMKTEYPLAHHAKFVDLHAAVAVRVRSTDMVDFVLEFFLPVNCKNREEQKRVINSLLDIIQKVCRSLRIVADMKLQEKGVKHGLLVQEIDSHGPGSGLDSCSGMAKRRAGAKLKDAAKNIGGKFMFSRKGSCYSYTR